MLRFTTIQDDNRIEAEESLYVPSETEDFLLKTAVGLPNRMITMFHGGIASPLNISRGRELSCCSSRDLLQHSYS